MTSLVALILTASVAAQTATLRTTDIELSVETSATAPHVVSLQSPGQPKWQNRTSETLITEADIAGKPTPLAWHFNPDTSQTTGRRVAFVYDCPSPHLRLTWEWRVPQSYGPLEHEIRIENLDNREIWIPLQDSLAFDWQIDPTTTLRQLFVDE